MKNVLVIGAAGGSGSATVRVLLERGDSVHGTVLNEAEAGLAKEQNPALRSISLLDLGRSEGLLDAMPAVLEKTGKLDAVIVCAAISVAGPLETTPLTQLRKVLEVNCVACLAIFQAVMPTLRSTRGRLIMISSISGKVAIPFLGNYTASKYALEGLTDTMRRETMGSGVEIILIEPGGIKTSMVVNQMRDVEEAIAAFSPAQDALYGQQFRQFHTVVSAGYEDYSPPQTIAAVIVKALHSDKPATRYLAGPDAEQFHGAINTMSDREIDTMFAQTFAVASA